MGARLKRSLGMAYTANATQFMAQMERAAVFERIYLRMLAEAGWQNDGMDGWRAPAGTSTGEGVRIWQAAMKEAEQQEKTNGL